MRQGRNRWLAVAMAVAASGPLGAAAHGLDINDLLRGTSDRPEAQTPSPVPAPSEPGLTDLLRGAERPQPESSADPPIAAAPPVLPFDEAALAGHWTGIGAHCADRSIDLAATDPGYAGTGARRNARSGAPVVSRIEARPDRLWQGAPHPLQEGAFFSYARQYSAQVTPADSAVPVPEGGWPLTLIVSRDPDTGNLSLRFLEPVTVCTFGREGG